MRIIVNIDVPDLVAGIEFYTNAFELKLSRILDDDVAELVGASSVIYLLQKPAGSSTSINSMRVRDYTRHWTPVHIDFVVEDLGEARTKALQAGATLESDCIEWMGSKCITFSDPFGHGFCLIEFRDQTYSSEI
jgi:predicted enzyme related to lactoylglutathione lyase